MWIRGVCNGWRSSKSRDLEAEMLLNALERAGTQSQIILNIFVRFAVFFGDLKTAAVLSLDGGCGFRYASAFGGEKDMHIPME